jgi:arginase
MRGLDEGRSGASVKIIGAALDLGASRRGVDMGPSAIRYAGLADRLTELGLTVEDDGNVSSPLREVLNPGPSSAHFVEEIHDSCSALASRVQLAAEEGYLPLVLGGDHSIAVGSVGGMTLARGHGGVIWVDAHGDLNTPATSPSGNVHGMPLAALLGDVPELMGEEWVNPPLDPEQLVIVGARRLDPEEKKYARRQGIRVYTMSEIDRKGLAAVMQEAIDHVSGGAFLHVSFDLDAVDPEVAPGVGTPVPGGLSYREAHLAMELIAESGLLSSLDLVEVNPVLDRAGTTAALAVELAASALGASIL